MRRTALVLTTFLILTIVVLVGCGGTAARPAGPSTTPTNPTPTSPTPTPPATTPPTTPSGTGTGGTGSGGTSSGGGAATSGMYVFTSGSLSDNIWGYKFDSNSGTLTALSGFPMSPSSNTTAHALCDKFCGASARWLTADPQGKYLFEDASAGGYAIFSFTVNPSTGALTQDDAIRTVMAYEPQIDPQGRFIAALTPNSDQTTALNIISIDRTTGHLAQAPGSPYTIGSSGCANPSSFGVALSTEHIYSAVRERCGGDSRTYGFNIGSNLSLSVAPGSPFDAGYLSDVNVMHPSGKWLYITQMTFVNGTGFTQIQQYTVNVDGSLTKTGNPVVTNTTGGGQTQFTPNGKFLLIPDASEQSTSGTPGMSVYVVDQNTGALTKGAFYPGMSDWLAFDPTSNWIFESTGTAINVYRIDPNTGVITKSSSAPVAVDPNNDRAASIAVIAAH